MSTPPKTYLTPGERLEMERQAACKSEYRNGERFAIARAREARNWIGGNTLRTLGPRLRQRGCPVAAGYPPVPVRSTAEVLFPSTEISDRTRQWEHYQTIKSRREYFLLSSDRLHPDLFVRQANRHGMIRSAGRRDENLEIPSLGGVWKRADIYDRASF